MDKQHTPEWIKTPMTARLNVEQVAALLGFSHYEIRHLISQKHLKVLGRPNRQQTKWVAAVQAIEYASDLAWLKRATDLCYRFNQRPDRNKQRALAR